MIVLLVFVGLMVSSKQEFVCIRHVDVRIFVYAPADCSMLPCRTGLCLTLVRSQCASHTNGWRDPEEDMAC